jgi:hypothetical protein
VSREDSPGSGTHTFAHDRSGGIDSTRAGKVSRRAQDGDRSCSPAADTVGCQPGVVHRGADRLLGGLSGSRLERGWPLAMRRVLLGLQVAHTLQGRRQETTAGNSLAGDAELDHDAKRGKEAGNCHCSARRNETETLRVAARPHQSSSAMIRSSRYTSPCRTARCLWPSTTNPNRS